MKRKIRLLLFFLFITSAFLLLNYSITTLWGETYVDMSGNQSHTLSEASKQILNDLKIKQTIRLYISPQIAKDYPQTSQYSRYVADLLKRYAKQSGGKLSFEQIEIEPYSKEEDDAKAVMMKEFNLTDNQAEAILNMKLRSLRKLEEHEIKAEFDELSAEKEGLESLLADEGKRWQALAEEIKQIKEKFGKKTALGRRRTEFAEAPADVEITIEALVEKEPVTVILSEKGWIRCLKGHVDLNEDFKFKDDDSLRLAIHAQTTDKIILFDTAGKFFTLQASEIPSGRGFGQPVRLMIDLSNNDNICSMFVFEPKASYLWLMKTMFWRRPAMVAKS